MTGAGGSEYRRLERTDLVERQLMFTTLAVGWLCRSHISRNRALFGWTTDNEIVLLLTSDGDDSF
jgi:hypothetical protein